MKKEIIVAADDLESRVAIIEDGELAELHVERDPRLVGSIFKCKVVSVLPGMDAAFADIGLEKNVFLCADDVGYVTETGVTSSNAPRSATISERLKSGQDVVVQIVRAPVAGKGARATTRLALPGRYLVLLLSDDRQIGVSRKIEERKERDRLRKVGEEIRPDGCTLIIRTEAEGKGKQDLSADLRVLTDLRDRLMDKAAHTRGPALLHQDLTLTYQVIRDAFNDEVDSLVIDSKSVHDNAVELIDMIAPHLRRRIKRYRGKLPIFYKYGIEGEIDRLLRRRVWLRAGGYISIDQAEAFTAIDVNTGRFTGTTGLADTILRTNLEAADEVGRQLRLRDLGGIIVVDFIDMDRPRHRQKVMKAFQDALRKDRQKTNIVHLSPLGLIEMTRKRRGESLMGIITEACPVCAGLGRVRTALTVALKIEREVRRIASEDKPQALLVRAVPKVAEIIVGDTGTRSLLLDKAAGCTVYVRADDRLASEEFDVVPGTNAGAARELSLPVKGEEISVSAVDPGEASNGDAKGAWYRGYRIMIEGVSSASGAPFPVILTEVTHSFAFGHVKGYERKPEALEESRRRSRRRSSRGRGTAEAAPDLAPEPTEVFELEPEEEDVAPTIASEPGLQEEAATETPARKRSRSRRSRGRRKPEAAGVDAAPTEEVPALEAPAPEPAAEAPAEAPTEEGAPARKRPSRRRSRSKSRPEQPAAPPVEAQIEVPVAPPVEAATSIEPGNEAAGPAPEKRRRRRGGHGRNRPRPEGPREPSEAAPEPAQSAPPPEARRRPEPRRARVEAPAPPPPPRPEPAPTPPPPAPPPAPPSEDAPRRTGLLRRGSRQLGRRK